MLRLHLPQTWGFPRGRLPLPPTVALCEGLSKPRDGRHPTLGLRSCVRAYPASRRLRELRAREPRPWRESVSRIAKTGSFHLSSWSPLPPSLCSSCKNDTKPLLQFQQWAGRGSDARSGFGTPKPALRVPHTTETLSRLAGAAVASNGIPSKPSAQAKPSSTGPATAVSTEPRQCAVGGNETRRLSRTTTRSGGSGHAIASASIAVLPPRQGRAALLRIVAPAAGVSSGERRNPSRRKRSPSPTLPPGRVSQHASKDP